MMEDIARILIGLLVMLILAVVVERCFPEADMQTPAIFMTGRTG